MTFDEWAIQHVLRFGLTDPELRMVISWREAFDAAGYTVAELCEATDWMTQHSAPSWRSDHLRLIQQRIADRRQFATEKLKAEALETESVCALCQSTGWVIVPHLACVQLGDWQAPFATFAVACDRCPLGRMKLEKARAMPDDNNRHNQRVKRTLAFSDYERGNPYWREQFAARSEAKRLLLDARGGATTLDKKLGELAGRFQLPSGRR